MSEKPPTLFEAVQAFLGPMHAECSRVIDEWSPDTPVKIDLGGYKYETTLADIKRLDRAYMHAFEMKEKRAEKKAKGSLL